MRLTTEFAAHFGFTTQTLLDRTFRFNNKIGVVAAGFIMKNPAQLAKDIHSVPKVYRQSADTVKRLVMELGGHAPFIVFKGADLDLSL